MATRKARGLYEIMADETLLMTIWGPADPLAVALGSQVLMIKIGQKTILPLHSGYNALYIHLWFPTSSGQPCDYTIDLEVESNGSASDLDSLAIRDSDPQPLQIRIVKNS